MSSSRSAACDPVHRPCNPMQVWELEAKMQQWEFAFVSANGRKPSFMERLQEAAKEAEKKQKETEHKKNDARTKRKKK